MEVVDVKAMMMRSAPARRWMELALVALVATIPLACTDRAKEADTAHAPVPIAVTRSGVEVTKVEKSRADRRIQADIVNGKETRTIVFEPLTDAPMPVGFTVRIEGGDAGAFEVSLAWDRATGRVWMRQRTALDAFEIARRAYDGRVYESCDLNGERVESDHVDLPGVQIDKAIARWRQGRFDPPTTDMRELESSFAQFDALAVTYRKSSLVANPDADLLRSLMNDPDFAAAISGESIDALRNDGNLATSLCHYLAICTGIACRFYAPACGFCAAGAIACAIVDIACGFIGCDCCS